MPQPPTTFGLALLAVTLLAAPSFGADAAHPGAAIYKAQCASCHGRAGEGTKSYPQPLVGDRALKPLAKLIAETMPENDPGSCSGPDAEAVAAYMIEAFYSKEARERNRPPRIELARLTVNQHRAVVADLLGSFRNRPALTPEFLAKSGLKGEYFNAPNPNRNKRVIERVDPTLAFDFGTGAPGDKVDAAEFSARWTGSVVAAETGIHDFLMRSDHAVRVWVNGDKKPVIDAWVKSGADNEFRASVYLIAGRAYPLKVEFSKAKQGVQDGKKAAKPVAAQATLEWKPPHGAWEPIPGRHLIPVVVPESLALSAPFPPDDRSLGWERGTTVSKAWDQATTEAAIQTVSYVADRLPELTGAKDGTPEAQAKYQEFARTFASRAFRAPLSKDEQTLYVDRHFAKDAPGLALRKALLLVLKSPRFLYREVGVDPADGHATAARLSFALWDSLPDAALTQAAAAGQLSTREQVAKQAERMSSDLRARLKLRGFLNHWFGTDQARDLSKDPKRFAAFTADAAADLRASFQRSLDEFLLTPETNFPKLLTGDDVYLTDRLAKVYGATLPATTKAERYARVPLDAGKRAGLLTHPYLLSTFAYTAESSPIHRGVFLARGVFGLTLRPPQEAFTPLAADLHPNLTTRERVGLQTSGANCQTCHAVINPLGFTLERFDAVGRYRETEGGKKVDASGQYVTRAGETKTFADVRDLARFVAGSEEVHEALTEQLFHHLVQQPIRAYGPRRQAELRAEFAKAGYNVRALAVEIATAAARVPRDGLASAKPPNDKAKPATPQ